jgi:hypothetical protein
MVVQRTARGAVDSWAFLCFRNLLGLVHDSIDEGGKEQFAQAG